MLTLGGLDLFGRLWPVARQKVAEGRLAILADWLIEAGEAPRELTQLGHLFDGQLGLGGDFIIGGLTPELGAQLAFDLADLGLALGDVNRKPDRPAVVLQPPLEGLADPQGAVG
ncbi:MAG: hypothetical protein M3016_05125, partial [Actinomycetota bacterium]|nr:hypothetical protein [Actinomycetota bacterium]